MVDFAGGHATRVGEATAEAITAEIEEDDILSRFVKPATAAAAWASRKSRSREELVSGVIEAFRFDRKLVVEKGVECREIECAVLGNDEPEASPLGEISCEREFYDYDGEVPGLHRRTLRFTGEGPGAMWRRRIRQTAIDAYRAIDCAGMARVDFFLTPSGEVFVDELNTIPGFTPGSMYPRLWQTGRAVLLGPYHPARRAGAGAIRGEEALCAGVTIGKTSARGRRRSDSGSGRCSASGHRRRCLAMLAGIVVGRLAAAQSPLLQVKKVTVEGADDLDPAVARRRLRPEGAEHLPGRHGARRRAVSSALPMVKDVSIERRWPGELVIKRRRSASPGATGR